MPALEEKIEKRVKNKPSDDCILASLFTQVVRPTDIVKTSCVNVYGDRYRINIWTSIPHPFMPVNGRITASYFAKVDSLGGVTILASN